jgi:hypothetical protein
LQIPHVVARPVEGARAFRNPPIGGGSASRPAKTGAPASPRGLTRARSGVDGG